MEILTLNANMKIMTLNAQMKIMALNAKMKITVVKPVKFLNLNFFQKKKGKTVIYRNNPEKSWDFSKSWVMKRIAPLELSRKI